MKTIVVAFDIDGTLRCNCTETCRDVNEDVVSLALLLRKMKNTKLIAWSGGGKRYTQAFIDSDDRLQYIFGEKCYGKLDYILTGRPDIAIDDQHEFALGLINLIIHMK